MARTKTTFTKGNAPKGHGGARPGAGRKPNVVLHVLDELLAHKINSKGAKGRTAVKLAFDGLVQATLDRDSQGRMTLAGVRACEIVLERAFGKVRQTLEVAGHIGGLETKIAAAELAAAQGDLRDVLG